MKDHKINEEKSFKISYLAFFLFFIFLLFVIVQQVIKPAEWDAFDLSKTGQIGDTIGGITAPVINLLGAVLVFLSFRVQYVANKNQQINLDRQLDNQSFDRNFQVISDLFIEFKGNYESLIYDDNDDDDTHYEGQAAINVFVNSVRDNWAKDKIKSHFDEPIFYDLHYLLVELSLILNHLNESKLRPSEKEKLELTIKKFYEIKLEHQMDGINSKLEKHSIVSQFNDAYKAIQDRFYH